METKVKGDKIKEGSIPLSALGDDVKKELDGKVGLYDYCGSLGRNVKNIDTDMYYMGTVFVVKGNSFHKLHKGTYDLNEIFGGPSAILNVYEKEMYLSLELQDTSGYWDGIDIYKGYNKPPQETPNWNAQEGEAGYIENKTHFIEWYNKPEDENFNDLLLGLKDKTPISVTEDGYIKIVKYVATNLSPMYEYDFEYFYKNWESDSNDIFRAFITVPDIFGGNAYPEISFSNDDDLYVTIQWNTEDTTDNVNEVIDQICGNYYIVPYHNYSVYPLNENYLPNTVLKTTPQTLSDTDKNQALANLGIDPVVWKYMCDPYVIFSGDPMGTIPEELVQIIFDEWGNLRRIVQNVITFDNGPIKEVAIIGQSMIRNINDKWFTINTDGTWQAN